MNAFHPEFMKTFYPDFWTEQVLSSRNSQAMTAFVEKRRKSKPSHGTLGISKKVVSLKPLDFLVFSRAGAPK